MKNVFIITCCGSVQGVWKSYKSAMKATHYPNEKDWDGHIDRLGYRIWKRGDWAITEHQVK